MNPYSILELPENKNISKDEIKKSYKRLILKYHPDKNHNIDTTEKFKEIHTAYEILINDDKKKEYDNLSHYDKIKYYETLKDLINKKYPIINDYLTYFIKNFYNDNENNLKLDLENFNFASIYNNILINIPNVLKNLPEKETNKLKNYVINVDINGQIKATIKDVYNNKFQKLLINRETKEPINIFVPLIFEEYILHNEGEIGLNNIIGDINIKINVNNSYNNFIKIDYDLYVELELPLYQFLYGGEIKFTNLDNNEIILNHESLINNNIIKIPDKGFIITKDNYIVDSLEYYEDYEDYELCCQKHIEVDESKRGTMFIICKIKDFDNIKEKIKEDFSN